MAAKFTEDTEMQLEAAENLEDTVKQRMLENKGIYLILISYFNSRERESFLKRGFFKRDFF